MMMMVMMKSNEHQETRAKTKRRGKYKKQKTIRRLFWKLNLNVEILSWNLCFENKRQEGGWGVCVCMWVGGGVMADLLSLWDHNDDKESITVLL